MTAKDHSGGALEGVRVLDVCSFIAGPMAAMMLGDFGADVIKIEHPRGDGFRYWGLAKDGEPLYWKMLSRNKRCITLDLHKPRAREILKSLVAVSDVVVENFTPGTMAAWGLGYEDLREINPRVIMLSISGFGQTGPYAKRPGFGTQAEAMTGYANITGEENGPPILPAFALADATAGMNGAFGVLAALNYRARKGVGQHVDTSLYEPLLMLLGPQILEYDQLGVIQERHGSRLPFATPRNLYPTKDGKYVAVAAGAQTIFERLMHSIGAPELIEDSRFANNRTRSVNAAALDEAIGGWMARNTAADILATIEKNKGIAAPVYNVAEVVEDPHYKARGTIATVIDPKLGAMRMQGPTPRLTASPGAIRFTGPALGAHNSEIYTGILQMSAAELEGLKAEGIV